MSSQIQPKEEWIKILNKGIITIPKRMRIQAGIKEGDMAKVKLQGKRIIIEANKEMTFDKFRKFTNKQINEWIEEDKLPDKLAKETEDYWKDLP